MFELKRLSKGKGNFLFGFHDISPWDSIGQNHVCLKVDDISAPPDPAIDYEIGYLNDAGDFFQVGITKTFNYPQGARQQWINDKQIIVNDRKGTRCISKVIDIETFETKLLDYPTHTIDKEGYAYSLDYARLFRLGAYGYAGLIDEYANHNYPHESGIIKHHIKNNVSKILVSVNEVANFQMLPKLGKHHYITHVVISPDQQRLAFLHRYKLSDGGETTRLMSIGKNGNDLRLLAIGFLSHFDWIDNDHVMIFGRIGSATEVLRNSGLYKIIPPEILKASKKLVKKILFKSKSVGASNFSWHSIADKMHTEPVKIGQGIITEDGHPMFCPVNRDWMICDNYPNHNGIRTLFLYNIVQNKKIDLDSFKMIPDKPDLRESEKLLRGTEAILLKTIGLDNMAFTRSGFHCDLHPRWSPDGKKVSFDSIHEGSRQIYQVKFNHLG